METSWSTDSGQPAFSAEQGLLTSRRRGGHLLAAEQFRTVRGWACTVAHRLWRYPIRRQMFVSSHRDLPIGGRDLTGARWTPIGGSDPAGEYGHDQEHAPTWVLPLR